MDSILDIGNKLNLKVMAPLTASIYYKGTSQLIQGSMGFSC